MTKFKIGDAVVINNGILNGVNGIVTEVIENRGLNTYTIFGKYEINGIPENEIEFTLKKVYVITIDFSRYREDGYTIDQVFFDKERAEIYVNKMDGTDGMHYSIVETTIE